MYMLLKERSRSFKNRDHVDMARYNCIDMHVMSATGLETSVEYCINVLCTCMLM